jgi:hypothetical protein
VERAPTSWKELTKKKLCLRGVRCPSIAVYCEVVAR